MAIRTVKQYTDRGSIKDLINKLGESVGETECQPIALEIRMKKLFDYASLHKDSKLQSALGFITTDYISDKNAIPLSVYRIRALVSDIKSKSPRKIDQLSEQFSQCLGSELSAEAVNYLNKKRALTKIAKVRQTPKFWRVSRP